jgi:hypothetical protein
LTTMFTVEDSSDNEFGDNHNGWENNKQWWVQCDAMVTMARAWTPMVMTPTEHLQITPCWHNTCLRQQVC